MSAPETFFVSFECVASHLFSVMLFFFFASFGRYLYYIIYYTISLDFTVITLNTGFMFMIRRSAMNTWMP